TQVSDTLVNAGQTKAYTLAVQGSGRLTAFVMPQTGSALAPRLTLSDVAGHLLVQSDDGRIVQNLQPGTYVLAVSARSGAGGYRLTTEFVQSSPPGDEIRVGFLTAGVTAADLNGDGVPDLTVVSKSGGVSVLLGDGDGAFQPQKGFGVDYGATSVAVADL